MGCAERFGTEGKGEARKRSGPSRRQWEIGNIRRRLRQLRKQFKEAGKAERKGLEELRQMERSRLRTLRQAERIKNKAREKRKTRNKFIGNPYKFVGDLL